MREGLVHLDYLLRGASLVLVFVVTAVALLVATELGRLLGRRLRARDSDKDAGSLATGMLGIFALLIAFTYSLALARYDARRSEVLQEANAIGTAANYASMLPPAARHAVLDELRTYTRLRTALGSPYDVPVFRQQVAQSGAIQARLWQQAAIVTAAEPQSLPAYRYVAALNEMTNISEARLTALRNHVPIIVLLVLAGVAMVSMGFAGYAAALSGFPRYAGFTIMALTITLLLTLVIDLDRPNRGTIEISVQPLRDALGAIPPG